jgi:hypothetical protein
MSDRLTEEGLNACALHAASADPNVDYLREDIRRLIAEVHESWSERDEAQGILTDMVNARDWACKPSGHQTEESMRFHCPDGVCRLRYGSPDSCLFYRARRALGKKDAK